MNCAAVTWLGVTNDIRFGMAASVEVEEEAECLAEIFGEAFMKNGEREWTVSILPGCTIMLFLPDGYPSTCVSSSVCSHGPKEGVARSLLLR